MFTVRFIRVTVARLSEVSALGIAARRRPSIAFSRSASAASLVGNSGVSGGAGGAGGGVGPGRDVSISRSNRRPYTSSS